VQAVNEDPGVRLSEVSLERFEFLRMQADQTWSKERRNLTWFGTRDGDSILELGCGPGWITEKLSQAFPNSRITALDHNPAALDFARARMEPQAGDRIRWITGKAEQTRLPDRSFDIVYARLVFYYLPDPLAAAAEARRLLKPGGRFVVTDSDDGLFGLTVPDLPELELLLARVGESKSRSGGDRRRARRLRNILAKAGFDPIDVEAVASDSAELGAARFFPLFDPEPLRRLVLSGDITSAEAARLAEARERFLADPDVYVLRILLMLCGRNPPR